MPYRLSPTRRRRRRPRSRRIASSTPPARSHVSLDGIVSTGDAMRSGFLDREKISAGRRGDLTGEDGQHFGGEALELLELILANEAQAEVGDSGIGVAAKGSDHRLGRPETHGAAHVHAAPVVGGEELAGAAFGRAHVVLEANGGVDAEGKAGKAPAVARERLVGPFPDDPTVLGLDVRCDDAV